MSKKFIYPTVFRDNSIADNYFGVEIKDPYRWLEDSYSEDTTKFVENQNKVSVSFLNSCTYREQINNRFRELFKYPRFSCPSKNGNNYFISINSGLQNQYVMYIMRGDLKTEPEVFFDPNALSSDGTISLSTNQFSEDGKWWAYSLQKSGSDWSSIKIKNVDNGLDLEEELTRIKFSTISWTKDNKGFFYSFYPNQNDCDGTETTENVFQKLFYHRLKTSQNDDVLVYESLEHPHYRFKSCVSDCGYYLHVFTIKSCEYDLWHFHRFDDPENIEIKEKLEFQAVVDEFESDYEYVTNDGPIHYLRTNQKAPNFRVVRVDLSSSQTRTKSNWQDLIKEDEKKVLQDVLVVRNNVLVCNYICDVISLIEMYNLTDGNFLKKIEIPVGTVNVFTGKRHHEEAFFMFSSFLTPGNVYHLKLDQSLSNQPVLLKESKPENFDSSKFETEQVFYTSKDGTRVPMFLVHKKNLIKDGLRPTLLYGYGGFNISLQPWFSPIRLLLLDNLDGVYALANIRGGGEYGQKWHDNAKLLKKQNCFDDFISAAEYLIKEKYTSPSKVAINGGSNGGLLVTAVANQRPDLFGCVIAQVGVLDMLRYHKFTIGYAWMSEYGSPDEQEHFENLLKYSPLHNIPDSVDRYPATLLLTADHDDRVVPLHSFKFISELQNKLGARLPTTPLMIRIDTKAGHGAGKPTEKIIEEFTDIFSFMINSLSWNYKL